MAKTRYKFAEVDGLDIFYREAGAQESPAILLLHGFPSGSHMFRDLIPLLGTDFRVVAPDLPGFGRSAMPEPGAFTYTFEKLAEVISGFTEAVGLKSFAIYVFDYGAPVGWRLFLKGPERVTALIIQNGNAYDEGLKKFWDPIKTYWNDGSKASRDALLGLVSLETTIFQYTDGVDDKTRISPDNWVHDQALLDRPMNADVQMDVMYDYRTNLPLYPAVQELFRKHQPPALIVWGERDFIFPADGAHPYKRDLKDLEFHLIPTGHFALEDRSDEMVPLIRDFLDRKVSGVK